MKHRLLAWALLAFTLLASGCATRMDMALKDDSQKITETSKPIYLMTAAFKNDVFTRYQPKLIVVNVEKPKAGAEAEKINFVPDDKAKYKKPGAGDEEFHYLVRMELEPGRYDLRGLSLMGNAFPFIGSFFAPLHMPLEPTAPGVYYLGHVKATVRPRQGNEFKAGPPLPLIDQAATGATGGTFDIEIIDLLEADEALFRSKFPALNGVTIKKAILPPFDRAKAQQWWESH